jgi:hypothetical protein
MEKGAVAQLAKFDAFCLKSLIGATSLLQGRDLVTGNSSHFSWMPGIQLLDWRKP